MNMKDDASQDSLLLSPNEENLLQECCEIDDIDSLCHLNPVHFSSMTESKVNLTNIVKSENVHPLCNLRTGNTNNLNSLDDEIPIFSNWYGAYGFKFSFETQQKQSSWIYSSSLNKLYVQMNSMVPINMHISGRTLINGPLFVHAIPYFSHPSLIQTAVVCCPEHSAKKQNKNWSENCWSHFIRLYDSPHAVYLKHGNRLSVRVPLSFSSPEEDTCVLFYKFMCKHSCIGGIARKPVLIIFYLEDQRQNILGKTILNVRSCACPLRDIKLDAKKISKISHQGIPDIKIYKNKKKKNDHRKVYKITIVGTKKLEKVKQYMIYILLEEQTSGFTFITKKLLKEVRSTVDRFIR